jgi:hypothetical protein
MKVQINDIIKQSEHDQKEALEALIKFSTWLDTSHKPNEYQTVPVLLMDFTIKMDPDASVSLDEFIGLLALFGIRHDQKTLQIYEV